MVNSILGKKFPSPTGRKLKSVALRGFGGGWNAVDDDISMQNKFLKIADNVYRTSSGSQKVRFGTNFFTDTKSVVNSPIIDQVYFNDRIINVHENGNITSVTIAGTVTVIWNTAIALALPGAPGAWGPTVTQVSFVPVKDKLVIHNGKDKPLRIKSTFAVEYLQDDATGSNVNTPIGKYGCIAANYHCVAGIPGSPTVVYLSNQGSEGVFPGDTAPNDGISIDVGAYAPEGAAEIRGVAGYRSFLIIHLQGISIQVTLGIHDSGSNHTPQFPDTFPKFGLIGDRCITTVENDLIFAGINGLGSASRNIYSGNLISDYLSSIIDPQYRRIIGTLNRDQQLVSTYTVFDQLSSCMFILSPSGETIVYTSNAKLKYKSWSRFKGWSWRCGCASFLGRVFFSDGTKIFQYGNDTFGEKYAADKMNDRDANWTTATPYMAGALIRDTVGQKSYTCGVTHTSGLLTMADDIAAHPTYWTLYEGVPITFEMEMPWFSGQENMGVKILKFLSMTTKGLGEFTIEAYVDNLFKDSTDAIIYTPAASMKFIGNDARGFGIDEGPFGGGRRSGSPQLYKFPVKFKMVKFRIVGSTTKALEFIGMNFLFMRGKYLRG